VLGYILYIYIFLYAYIAIDQQRGYLTWKKFPPYTWTSLKWSVFLRYFALPITVAARSEPAARFLWLRARIPPGTKMSVRYRSLCRADHSSRGVAQSVVCLSVIVKLRQWRGNSPLGGLGGGGGGGGEGNKSRYFFTGISCCPWIIHISITYSLFI
jgi:hypothetical protein